MNTSPVSSKDSIQIDSFISSTDHQRAVFQVLYASLIAHVEASINSALNGIIHSETKSILILNAVIQEIQTVSRGFAVQSHFIALE